MTCRPARASRVWMSGLSIARTKSRSMRKGVILATLDVVSRTSARFRLGIYMARRKPQQPAAP